MGTPIPDDSESLPCSLCWGPDKAFGLSPPPRFLTVTFSGIEKTPAWTPGAGEPPDGLFLLPQSDVSGCFYNLRITDTQVMFVLFAAGITFCEATSTTGQACFDAEGSECETNLENLDTVFFENGTCIVSFEE